MRPHALVVVAASSSLLVATVASSVVATAAPRSTSAPAASHHGPLARVAAGREHPNEDLRSDDSAQATLQSRQLRSLAHPRAGLTALRGNLGVQGVVTLDPLTGTPSNVSKLNGFLTGPSTASASSIALGYVRQRLGAFGLSSKDLATLRLRKTYVDIDGTRHLSYTQYAGSVPVFGNGLKAHVTKTGRLISVQGSPIHGLSSLGTSTRLDAAAARRTALRDVDSRVPAAKVRGTRGAARLTTFSTGDRASLVSFQTVTGQQLAWQTMSRVPGGHTYMHVVDASSGRVLYRRDLTQSDSGRVVDYWPGAPNGGTTHDVDLTSRGWLPSGSPRLAGYNAHVWSDVNDDDVAQKSEEVTPGPTSFKFPFTDFTGTDGPPCAKQFQCSWDSSTPFSWQKNRKQDAVQVFYYVNRMHDHLKASPIGFNRAAGNFEAVDDDAVQAQPDDGANTADGFPDFNHTDNANMDTPPDGMAPTMQMYLFNDPSDPADDPFLQVNGGDEADIVYHEYTHGLSNRLVVDSNGVSTLGNVQAGSMGEAWSDWYAMDFLNDLGFQKDTSAPGEVRIGEYVGKKQDLIRTQPLDCPVGSKSAACPGTPGAGPGGYTYGDFGKIIGFPEVHADGEIWGETLWDLRDALGSKLSESLITRAMELSPANPSYLDMRNSILQADTVDNKGLARATIWKVFAHRGMGYFAGTLDGDDVQPVQSFSLPPAAGAAKGSLTGTVTDVDTHAAAPGTTVAFGGHFSGFPTDYVATTNSQGRYTIGGIFVGTYPDVWAGSDGFDKDVRTLSIHSGANQRNWSVRRDWASIKGGAHVTDTTDDGYAPFGCVTSALFDQSQLQGWSTDRVVVGNKVQPNSVTLKLPQTVNVNQVAIDPSGNCTDDPTASTGPYKLETSTNGTTWHAAASGTFTSSNDGRFNSPALASGSTAKVRFIRYTMRDSQGCVDGSSGCDFIDSSELEVYGLPVG
jgi:extracellular elastinolytic metalloproteinase